MRPTVLNLVLAAVVISTTVIVTRVVAVAAGLDAIASPDVVLVIRRITSTILLVDPTVRNLVYALTSPLAVPEAIPMVLRSKIGISLDNAISG